MKPLQLTLETIKDLNEDVVVHFNQHLIAAGRDCIQRPGEKAKREITLRVIYTPILAPGGECDKVDIQIKAELGKLPAHASPGYSCGLTAKGATLFNVDALDNYDQKTFTHEDEEK